MQLKKVPSSNWFPWPLHSPTHRPHPKSQERTQCLQAFEWRDIPGHEEKGRYQPSQTPSRMPIHVEAKGTNVPHFLEGLETTAVEDPPDGQKERRTVDANWFPTREVRQNMMGVRANETFSLRLGMVQIRKSQSGPVKGGQKSNKLSSCFKVLLFLQVGMWMHILYIKAKEVSTRNCTHWTALLARRKPLLDSRIQRLHHIIPFTTFEEERPIYWKIFFVKTSLPLFREGRKQNFRWKIWFFFPRFCWQILLTLNQRLRN